MSPTLRALLSELIDYAGLFPPAELSLDTAIGSYARYRGGPEAWMLGRFICPVGRLAELGPYAGSFGGGRPLRVSAHFRGADERTAWQPRLRAQLESLRAFQETHGWWSAVEAFEVRLPGDIDSRGVAGFLAEVERTFESMGVGMPQEVYELSMNDEGLAAIPEFSRVRLPQREGRRRERVTLKLRTGGPEASAVPSSEQVAGVIERCCVAQVPLKFTAGLHHPFRRYDPGLRAHVHGFINVFVAGVLAYSLKLGRHDIRAVLEEEDPRTFRFSDDFLGWNDADATLAEVEYARRHCVTSFGSCSFDEPREDLKRFGLLS